MLSNKKATWFCNRQPWSHCIELAVALDAGGGRRAIAAPVAFTVHDEGQIIEPMIRIDLDEAQQLIDELWRCGMRPSEGTGSAGALAATERHLADMSKIAMGLLKKHGV